MAVHSTSASQKFQPGRNREFNQIIVSINRRCLATAEAKLKNWQTIWPLAGRQIGILGGISLVSSVFSWFKETNEDHAFLLLVHLGVHVGLMVWTLGLLLPINLQLNDGTSI